MRFHVENKCSVPFLRWSYLNVNLSWEWDPEFSFKLLQIACETNGDYYSVVCYSPA